MSLFTTKGEGKIRVDVPDALRQDVDALHALIDRLAEQVARDMRDHDEPGLQQSLTPSAPDGHDHERELYVGRGNRLGSRLTVSWKPQDTDDDDVDELAPDAGEPELVLEFEAWTPLDDLVGKGAFAFGVLCALAVIVGPSFGMKIRGGGGGLIMGVVQAPVVFLAGFMGAYLNWIVLRPLFFIGTRKANERLLARLRERALAALAAVEEWPLEVREATTS